jgi:hypothetical protein
LSGRVRVTLSDGRHVVGYRKTLARRAPRTAPHLLPDWRLSIVLPRTDLRFLGLNLGHVPGVIGAVLHPLDRLEIAGKNRDWVLRQAVAFVRRVAPTFIGQLEGVLERDAYPGIPRASSVVTTIRIDRGRACAEVGSSMRRIDV